MDKAIPLPAARILDFIGNIEAPKGYGTIYGNNQNKLAVPLTEMTLGDVIAEQATWTKRFKSSACGRYQFMRATLIMLRTQLGLSNLDKFTPDYQDRLGFELLKRRKYAKWLSGEISHDDFMVELAKEWASFPVPKDMKGAHRAVKRGETYYAGDKLNKSLVDPAKVWTLLQDARKGVNVPKELAPEPELPLEPAPLPPVEQKPLPAPVTKPEQTVGFWSKLAEALVAAAAVLRRS